MTKSAKSQRARSPENARSADGRTQVMRYDPARRSGNGVPDLRPFALPDSLDSDIEAGGTPGEPKVVAVDA
jgi:hypothetical protein